MKRYISRLLIIAVILMTIPAQAWATVDGNAGNPENENAGVTSVDTAEEEQSEAEPDLSGIEDIAENIAEDIDLSSGTDDAVIESAVAEQVDDNADVASTEAQGLPASVDLRDRGLVSEVQDQGATNTCWAFAPLASAESTATADTGASYNFSELYAAAYANSLHDGEGMQVTSDGEMVNPFYGIGDNGEYVASRMTAWAGPADETLMGIQYPSYDDVDETILGGMDEMDESVMSGVHVQDVEYLPSPAKRTSSDGNGFAYAGYNEAGTQAIRQDVADGAAVMVLLKAPELSDADYVNYANNAMYVSDDDMQLDHAVAIVGYDDNYSRDNFSTTPEGDGAWICKNSWGSMDNYIDQFLDQIGDDDTRARALKAYGTAHPELSADKLSDVSDEELAGWLYDMMMPIDRDGYFYVSYYDKTLYHPTVYRAEQNDYDVNHQYDQLGMLNPTTLAMSENSGTVANVFTADTAEELKAVSAYSSIPGCTAEITVCKVGDDGKPDTGAVMTATSAELTWAGFHTVELDQNISLSEGDTFAVVEKITTPAGKGYTPVEIEGSKEWGVNLYSYIVNDDEEGQSFIMTGDEWTDLSDYEGFGCKAGNAMIKAYATSDEDESGDVQPENPDESGDADIENPDESGDADIENPDDSGDADADIPDEYDAEEDEDAYYVTGESAEDIENDNQPEPQAAGESLPADSSVRTNHSDSAANSGDTASGTSVDVPDTGDYSRLGLYAFGLGGAVIILIAVALIRKKNR